MEQGEAAAKKCFLKTVKLFAELYETDTDIYETEWGYAAHLKLNVLTFRGYYKDLINRMLKLADSFDLYIGDEGEKDVILLSIRYYTHDRYYKGEQKTNL